MSEQGSDIAWTRGRRSCDRPGTVHNCMGDDERTWTAAFFVDGKKEAGR